MTEINRTQVAGLAGVGIFACILLAIFDQVILVLIAGCLIGAALVYIMLLAAPDSYDDEEQEMTDDEILFVHDDF